MIESLLTYFQVMERIVRENDNRIKKTKSCKTRLVLENLIQSKINEQNRCKKAKSELYIDWKNGEITHEEYLDFKEQITEKIDTLNAEIEEAQMTKTKRITDQSTEFFCYKDKDEGVCRLTRSYLIELIEKIYVYEKNSVLVKVKYDILSNSICPFAVR